MLTLLIAAEACRGNHLEFNVGIDPKAITGQDQLPVTWDTMRKAQPDLVDAFASPSGRLVVLVTKNSIEARVDDKTLGQTQVKGAIPVMAQWATGAKNVERWSNEANKVLGGAQSRNTPANDPRKVVELIYQIQVGTDGKSAGPSIVFQRDARHRFFSAALAAALDAEQEETIRTHSLVALDWDPVTNSQWAQVYGLRITTESQTDFKAIVDAHMTFPEKDRSRKPPEELVRRGVVHFNLITENGEWRVDDMAGEWDGEDKWELRDVLKRWIQPAAVKENEGGRSN